MHRLQQPGSQDWDQEIPIALFRHHPSRSQLRAARVIGWIRKMMSGSASQISRHHVPSCHLPLYHEIIAVPRSVVATGELVTIVMSAELDKVGEAIVIIVALAIIVRAAIVALVAIVRAIIVVPILIATMTIAVPLPTG